MGRVKPDIPELVYHVAFWVPVLVLAVAEDFDKLLQYGRLAAAAALGKLGGVVVMAVHLPVMLVVAVLGSEDGRTERAGKVVDVVFSVEGGDVRPSKGPAALVT